MESGKEAGDAVQNNFYVDDLLRSVGDLDTAKVFVNNIISMCMSDMVSSPPGWWGDKFWGNGNLLNRALNWGASSYERLLSAIKWEESFTFSEETENYVENINE